MGSKMPFAPGDRARRCQFSEAASPPTTRPEQAGSAHLQPSGVSVRRIESEEPSTRRKSGHEPAPFGTTRHYVAQDQPLHVVVGGCALSITQPVMQWVPWMPTLP